MQGKMCIVTHVTAPVGQAGADALAAGRAKVIVSASAESNFTISQMMPFAGGWA
ncbi:hypothetical protein JYT88_00965 [Rhodospirillaceae bacterium AH-315-P19]|nr:hypothetical protein [Rhodospirillaceae bacterium AH-315-P19]